MSGTQSWDADPASLSLRTYLLDHTLPAREGPSKPSPADVVGEDLEEGGWNWDKDKKDGLLEERA